MRTVFVVLAVLALAGCAGLGQPITTQKMFQTDGDGGEFPDTFTVSITVPPTVTTVNIGDVRILTQEQTTGDQTIRDSAATADVKPDIKVTPGG